MSSKSDSFVFMNNNKQNVWGKARWIGAHVRCSALEYAPVFRRRFIAKPFKKAVCAICGLGHFQLKINGKLVSSDLMTPAFTRYDVRVEYYLYDCTEFIQAGENVIEVMLGNGMFNPVTIDKFHSERREWRSDPKFILNLQLDNESTLVSDTSWYAAAGAITENSIRTGEKFDANRQLPEWEVGAKIDENVWSKAVISDAPGGKLDQATAPACRVIAALEVEKTWQLPDGAVMYMFPENIAGNCRLTVDGEAGSVVRLEHGELLNDYGDLDNEHIASYTLDSDFQTDEYILDNTGLQSWNPTFTYHGFQYVKVSVKGKAKVKKLTARIIRNNFACIGKASCSDKSINELTRLALRAYESNFVNMPTDCPHREKMGWTGDAQLAAELGLWHYDVKENYRSWLASVRDCQKNSGQIPGMVPFCLHWQFGPVWDGALIILPYQIWRFTGDTTVIGENYAAAEKLMAYFDSIAADFLIDFGPGDWSHHKRSRAIAGKVDASAYYFYCAECMEKMAAALGKTNDAAAWKTLAMNIKSAFQREFCRPGGHCAKDEAAALALALDFEIAEDSEKAAMAARLNEYMLKRNCRADFGISGAKAVPRALAKNGYFDTALTIFTQKEYPGWGYWLEHNAGSLWESWDGKKSRNHVMFGDVGAWLWEYAGGVAPAAEQAGFKHFTVKPPQSSKLSSFSGRHRTPHGDLNWQWQQQNGTFTAQLTVPDNCTASVILPSGESRELSSGTFEFECSVVS